MYDELCISKGLTGKMTDIQSISTNPLTNSFCQYMSKDCNSVCHKCYAITYSKIRPCMVKTYQKNSDILSSKMDVMPRIYADVLRFNSFGEIINRQHYENIVQICEENPRTLFTLWTKKAYIVQNVGIKPENLILIYSSPYLNKVAERPEMFDKVFTVFTKDYIKENKLDINCGLKDKNGKKKKCRECMICYLQNGIEQIYVQKK